MKIAVATDDAVTISRHFGRSKCFQVFEVEGDRIVGSTTLANIATHHAAGNCHGHDGERDGHPGHDQPGHGHDHQSLVELLDGCELVLCQGMGWRAAEDLKRHGIEVFLIKAESTPEVAVRSFLGGQARQAVDFCRGHHG